LLGLKELWACCFNLKATRTSKTVGARKGLIDVDKQWANEVIQSSAVYEKIPTQMANPIQDL
jgi:hypothetical protein